MNSEISDKNMPIQFKIETFSLKKLIAAITENITILKLLILKTIELSIPLSFNAISKKYIEPKFANPSNIPTNQTLGLKKFFKIAELKRHNIIPIIPAKEKDKPEKIEYISEVKYVV